MDDDIAIKVEHVSKKYCKSLKRSMLYGVKDIARNTIGLGSHSEKLRKDEFWAVENVSFELKKGETLGIIGPNGSGKTTLLKMLNGIFWPDKGKITIKGKVGALIEVGAGFHPMLTGRENIYINGAILGMSKKEIDEKFDDIVLFADIGDFLDSPVKTYSSGMYVRLGFAVAVHCEPEILIIDEILAVGDIAFQNKCLNKISNYAELGDKSIIFVSHDMNSMRLLCDRCLLLNKGNLILDDKPNKVIDGLSTIFSTKRKDSFFSNIINIYFEDKLHNIVTELNCKESYHLIIEFKSIFIEKGLFIAFSFVNLENKFSFRLETDKFKNLKGHFVNKKISINFTELCLPRGAYTIRMAISEGSYVNRKHNFEETIHFKVKDDIESPKFLQPIWEEIM